MRYNVFYTFGACIIVEADSKEMAEFIVAEKYHGQLMDYCADGFYIQSGKR